MVGDHAESDGATAGATASQTHGFGLMVPFPTVVRC